MFRPVPLLPFVLIAGCAVLLVLLTAASARRGLPRPLPGDRAVVVRHNHVFRWSVLAIAVLVPVGLTVLLRFVPPVRPDVPYLLGVYLVFTGIMVPLFHPRQQRWSQHFLWSQDTTGVVGRTPIGRATVERLRLNREGVVNLRRVLATIGQHPPQIRDP